MTRSGQLGRQQVAEELKTVTYMAIPPMEERREREREVRQDLVGQDQVGWLVKIRSVGGSMSGRLVSQDLVGWLAKI